MSDYIDDYAKLQKASELILEVFNNRNDTESLIEMSTATRDISTAHGRTLSAIQGLRLEEKYKYREGAGERLSDESSNI